MFPGDKPAVPLILSPRNHVRDKRKLSEDVGAGEEKEEDVGAGEEKEEGVGAGEEKGEDVEENREIRDELQSIGKFMSPSSKPNTITLRGSGD
jgi:hypothetical protein